jgi:ligand-binding SRPBCC domain-containing protein
MPHIHLTTVIYAPVERVFDLSRSIYLHKKSMEHTNEQAIAGTTVGLINEGETVTWQAKHLRKQRMLKVKITSMKLYESFTDEMMEGDFKNMQHHHHFKPIANGTVMIDEFIFQSPYGFIGNLVNRFYLTNYMKQLLTNRNEIIKQYAESNKWKIVLESKVAV